MVLWHLSDYCFHCLISMYVRSNKRSQNHYKNDKRKYEAVAKVLETSKKYKHPRGFLVSRLVFSVHYVRYKFLNQFN